MEAKALEKLEQLIGAANGKRIEGTDIPLILVPNGFNQVSLEQYLKQRVRFRGTLETISFKDFVEQATARKGDKGKAFVKAESSGEMTCTIIHNIGTMDAPGHCDDKTVLTMEATTAFAAVKAIDGARKEQREFSEWLEDWASHLTAQDSDGKDIPLARAISAVRKITVEEISKAEHQVSSMSASRSAMDSIAASSSEPLPASFTFKTKPYEGMQERTIVLRLGVLTGNGRPMPVVRWAQKEAQLEEITQEFKELLKKEIGGFYQLVLGSFSTK